MSATTLVALPGALGLSGDAATFVSNVREAMRNILIKSTMARDVLGDRIYPNTIPQSPTYPCALYFRVDATPFHGVHHDSQWQRARVQFSVFGRTAMEADSASRAIAFSLARYHGTVGGVTIDDCTLIAMRDLFDEEPLTTGVHHVALDFEIIYRE